MTVLHSQFTGWILNLSPYLKVTSGTGHLMPLWNGCLREMVWVAWSTEDTSPWYTPKVGPQLIETRLPNQSAAILSENHIYQEKKQSNEYRIIALATSSAFNPADAITHHLNNKASNITRFQHIIKANICISFDWLTKSQCDCGLSRKHPAESYFICRAGCYFQAH